MTETQIEIVETMSEAVFVTAVEFIFDTDDPIDFTIELHQSCK